MSEHSWITKEALQAAMAIVYEHLQGEWPEDDWFSIDDRHDLNLFTHTGNEKLAVMCEVVNGRTDTEQFVRIFELGEIGAPSSFSPLVNEPGYVRFSLAELIEWGYETSGDFDEAMRVYTEQKQHEGLTLVFAHGDTEKAREAFKREFERAI